MSTSKVKNRDLPAFASVAISGNDGYQQDGLSKREYFAAMAMQALLPKIPMGHNNQFSLYPLDAEGIASVSIQIADKLLHKLETTNQ